MTSSRSTSVSIQPSVFTPEGVCTAVGPTPSCTSSNMWTSPVAGVSTTSTSLGAQHSRHTHSHLGFSLYPSINYGINNEIWPVGQATVYIGAEMKQGPSTDEWFGLVHLDILPPRRLCHPVLAETLGGKLVFHLCSACSRSNRDGPCDHTDKERVITSTYFTGEVDLAIKMGYTVLRVHELYHWPSSQRSGSLFSAMIRDQYANKALASPVPSDPVELAKLIAEYEDTMGLVLKPEDFHENKAQRSNAKYSINNHCECLSDSSHTHVSFQGASWARMGK